MKGASGNPGGRPKGVTTLVKSVCGDNGERLVALYWLYASGTDAAIKKRFGTKYGPRHEARLEALKELRNMGYGIPKQELEVSSPDGAPMGRLSEAALEQIAAIYEHASHV